MASSLVVPDHRQHRSCLLLQAVRIASQRTGLALVLALFCLALAIAQDHPTTRVGLPLTLRDLYIPGGEARPKPRPDRAPPLVLRLLAVKPAQDGRRYDLEIYGLDPGQYDLADFLEAVDPAAPPRFPAIPLQITTDLPPGLPRPGALESVAPPKIGGYKLALIIGGVLWLAGLLALLAWRRSRPQPSPDTAQPVPLIARLRALLNTASLGELDDDQKATLERLILGYWRDRLPALADQPPARALATLRHHEQAGPLLRQLERWLHAPNPDPDPDHIESLLAPYHSTP